MTRVGETSGDASKAARILAFVLGLALIDGAADAVEAVPPAPPVDAQQRPVPREEISLNGTWFFRRDDATADSWKRVTVPSSFESHEGVEFDGVGWYRKEVPPLTVPPTRRVLLHFEAAATQADVWWNGEKLGSHLGAWTPFRLDVTAHIRKASPGRNHEIRVRLDEKVGHNTQGFLPVIAPHFGGIWQEVKLLIVPDLFVDDLRLLATGDVNTSSIRLEFPVLGRNEEEPLAAGLRYRLRGHPTWSTRTYRIPSEASDIKMQATVGEARRWSPSHPQLYDVEVEVWGAERGRRTADRVSVPVGFREIETRGRTLLLNGKPLGIRGLLNWGYYPPRTAPLPPEETFRRDLKLARSLGFNLVKFCLWVPPKRCLELADDFGMLTWEEYPTWHPRLTQEHAGELAQEFREFFYHDRNHPSVVLRSLTCETGHGADLAVIRLLYDMAHEMIPSAVVEDDSSWIGWHRVHDFYDDHPYGNNHTWVANLKRLDEHIRQHGPKPLVLGEAIAADTWLNRAPVLRRVAGERPWWLPGFFDANAEWLERMRRNAGDGGLQELEPDSLRYGLLMRKYQIETFRREIPHGGYVVSVLRDFPLASMGFLDYREQPKWNPAAWRWHGDTLCILKTRDDRRAFAAGNEVSLKFYVSHFGERTLAESDLEITLIDASGKDRRLVGRSRRRAQPPGTLVGDVEYPSVAMPDVARPQRFVLRSELRCGDQVILNEWPLWVVPRRDRAARPRIAVHRTVPAALRSELFADASPLGEAGVEGVVVASKFDDRLVKVLENGGKVLLLPDGGKRSFPLRAHWFLRGAPYISRHPLTDTVPRDFLLELQHFDLASDVVYDMGYLEQIAPVLLLWDNHDLKTVKTHGLIFETMAGKGRLLVSAVKHAPRSNAAGRFLLDALLAHLVAGPPPGKRLTEESWKHIQLKLHEERIELVKRPWRFKPDPKNEGLTLGWHERDFELDDSWKEIRIDKHWEAQGYDTLDGWAWYRLQVLVPSSWKGREAFLSFEGADDFYELYVNGKLAGTGGDLEKRLTAFEERKSHRITPLVTPGETCSFAIRIHDWYGAGGIFRPVTLGTVPFAPGVETLR